MKTIPLTKGKEAIVDAGDHPYLSQFNWHFTEGYAARYDSKVPSKRVWMHREILKLRPRQKVDHINRNGLDNRRENLRPCTVTQNNWNQGPRKGKMYSPYKGVSFNKQRGLWRAQISANRKQHFLGDFKKEEHAVIAYMAAARVLHGKFSFDPLQ